MTDHPGLDDATAERGHGVCSECRIDGTCPNDGSWTPTAALTLMRRGIVEFEQTKAADELSRLGQEMERDGGLDAAHAQLRAQAVDLDELRAEIVELEELAGLSLDRARRIDQMQEQIDRLRAQRDHHSAAARDLLAELSALRDGRVPTNHRENSDHNAVMTGVARALDREGLAWEQVEEVTDACLTYVENHHGVRCPGDMCPNSYRGENAERQLIQHYLRVHSEAAVKYLRAHGLYEAPVDDTGPGHALEQDDEPAFSANLRMPRHPRDEACIHCARPDRLASSDPVIDCPVSGCPNRPAAPAKPTTVRWRADGGAKPA